MKKSLNIKLSKRLTYFLKCLLNQQRDHSPENYFISISTLLESWVSSSYTYMLNIVEIIVTFIFKKIFQFFLSNNLKVFQCSLLVQTFKSSIRSLASMESQTILQILMSQKQLLQKRTLFHFISQYFKIFHNYFNIISYYSQISN